VNQAAQVHLVECGANLNGVTQRLFGRQGTSRESLDQKLAPDALAAGKTHFALAHFDHGLSTGRHSPRQPLSLLSIRFYYPLCRITMNRRKTKSRLYYPTMARH
jgi:hypothetical protein